MGWKRAFLTKHIVYADNTSKRQRTYEPYRGRWERERATVIQLSFYLKMFNKQLIKLETYG